MRGGGGAPVPTLFNQKMGLFHEKIICLEKPKMQNKDQIFGKIWEFGPTRSTPPLPQSWDAQN